jgi:manganese transport protein
MVDFEDQSAGDELGQSPAAVAALTAGQGGRSSFQSNRVWSYFGPAFVASVAYIDPGNFATNILGGSQFGYRLLWVLLWSNAMAILIQYLSAKLGIVTGLTLPQNCRKHFTKRTTVLLWVCAEISAVATDLAEFLGAAIGLDLLIGPAMLAHGMTPLGSLFLSAAISTVAVFAILALDLAGFQWLVRGIMAFVGVIGLCYGFASGLAHGLRCDDPADVRFQQPPGAERKRVCGGGHAGSDGDAACDLPALGAGAA